MDALAAVEGPAVPMPYGQEFERLRGVYVPDPYDPDEGMVTWDDPDIITVSGFLASTASVQALASREQDSPVRSQLITTNMLTLTDPDADVERGDRIRQGDRVWTVTGYPSQDQNPFTGWQPTRVCYLEEVTG